MRNFIRKSMQVLKWLLIVLAGVEIGSFLIITVSNYIIFGKTREGSKVYYDPYALYLNVDGGRPTVNNPTPSAPAKVLWLLGGSTLRGSTVNDAKTIPSLLAAILNRDTPGWRLSKFGEHSYNSLLEAEYLQKLLIESRQPPTCIIFYDGANDCTYFIRRLQALIESYHRSFLGLLQPLNAAWNASFTRELAQKFRGAAVPLKQADGVHLLDAGRKLVAWHMAQVLEKRQVKP